MSYENIQLTAPNMTGDRTNTNFYCFSGGVVYVKQRGAPYSLVTMYPLDRYIGTVACTQFDGVYYWTLEKQTNGILIQKWELVSGILRWRDSFSYVSGIGTSYDADCFVVDYYSSTLSVGANAGATSLEVASGDTFNIGDSIVLGPSTVVAFSGKFETVSVVNKSGNTLTISPALTKGFSSSNAVYTSRYFYVFNKYSPYDTSRGALLKYKVGTGTLNSYSSSHMFGGVKAACFYNSKITFVKGHEIIQVSTAPMTVYKHFAIDNLDIDRASIVSIEALWIYSDVMYLLQNKKVFYTPGYGWDSEEWESYYNYVTTVFHTLITSVVYFVEVKAEPDILHAIAPDVLTAVSNITVTVLDQARQPLSGRTVSMTSTLGSLSPSSGVTDSSGVFTCVYNGTSDDAVVTITATAT